MQDPGAYNNLVADKLRNRADAIEREGGDPVEAGAYRRAAEEIARMERDIRDILATEGVEGVAALPSVRESIAAAIDELVSSTRGPR